MGTRPTRTRRQRLLVHVQLSAPCHGVLLRIFQTKLPLLLSRSRFPSPLLEEALRLPPGRRRFRTCHHRHRRRRRHSRHLRQQQTGKKMQNAGCSGRSDSPDWFHCVCVCGCVYVRQPLIIDNYLDSSMKAVTTKMPRTASVADSAGCHR